MAVAAQSASLAPADGAIYALRDVTGTVPAPALIATSVMSKKLAAGADAILLDVKVGDGAFCRTLEEARALALLMRGLGERAGVPTVCELTRMDEPLGLAVGNAVETAEALDLLRGEGPDDLRELVLASAGRMLALSDLGVDEAEGRRRAEHAIASGAAVAMAERWIEAQGGDARCVRDPWSVFERAPVEVEVAAPRSGYVSACGALAIGRAAMTLGAGRARKQDPVDHAVGVVLVRKVGDRVEQGGAARARARTRSRLGGTGGRRGRRRLRDRRRAGRASRAAARDDRLAGQLVDRVRQLEVVLGDAARAVRGQVDHDRAVDVRPLGVVIHALRDRARHAS